MAGDPSLWSALYGAVGAAVGVIGTSLWDRYQGYKADIPIEVWRLRATQLERMLSEFYWPLYTRLAQDDAAWDKVFMHLRPRSDMQQPEWVQSMSDEARHKLSSEMENAVLLPNHLAAVEIIRSSSHLANANADLMALLNQYIKHVEVYRSLRAANINRDPIGVGEPYPPELTKTVKLWLDRYQKEYDELLQREEIVDAARTALNRVIHRIR